MLEEPDRADFTYYLRKALGLSDGNLSHHLTVLEQAGHVEIRKTFEGRKPRTWVRTTRQGRGALSAEIAALRDLTAASTPRRAGPPRSRRQGRRRQGPDGDHRRARAHQAVRCVTAVDDLSFTVLPAR